MYKKSNVRSARTEVDMRVKVSLITVIPIYIYIGINKVIYITYVKFGGRRRCALNKELQTKVE